MNFIFTLFISTTLITDHLLNHFHSNKTLSYTKQYAKGYVYHDENENLYMDNNEIGIPDVYVSNGVEIVKTDKDGKFMKPEIRTIIVWWFYSLIAIGLILFLINLIISTLF